MIYINQTKNSNFVALLIDQNFWELVNKLVAGIGAAAQAILVVSQDNHRLETEI